MFEMTIVEEEGGHEVAVTGHEHSKVSIAPLGLSELHAHLVNNADIPIQITGAHLEVSGPKHTLAGPGKVAFSLNPRLPIEVFGLVEGGWLPVYFTQADFLFPDANVAKKFSRLSREIATPLPKGLEHFDMAARHIHPILSVIEGNQRQFPTLEVLTEEANSTALRLKNGMPDQSIVIPDGGHLLGAYRMVEDRKRTYARDESFLLQAYPLISNRIKNDRLSAVHDEIDRIALNLGISRHSFLYLLTLDCLYDNHPVKHALESPGRAVLKPRGAADPGGVYNALFDVWQLEFLVHIHHVVGSARVAICTMDKGLAKAWAMFRPRDFSRGNGCTNLTLSLPEGFALRMPPARREALFPT